MIIYLELICDTIHDIRLLTEEITSIALFFLCSVQFIVLITPIRHGKTTKTIEFDGVFGTAAGQVRGGGIL